MDINSDMLNYTSKIDKIIYNFYCADILFLKILY